MRIHLPVSVAEAEIKKRYETIPAATLHPNRDEIEYLKRLVIHKVFFFRMMFSHLAAFIITAVTKAFGGQLCKPLILCTANSAVS